jgi:hypothetical protein
VQPVAQPTCEIYGRYAGDAGEIQGGYRVAQKVQPVAQPTCEIYGRYAGDAGEIQGGYSVAQKVQPVAQPTWVWVQVRGRVS